MSLRWRAVLIAGIALIVPWALAAAWMMHGVQANLDRALDERLIYDLDKDGSEYLAAIGGAPGQGNQHQAFETFRFYKYVKETNFVGTPGSSAVLELRRAKSMCR